jgi:hypothetical protein
MAKLFDIQERIVPTWLAAAQYLEPLTGHSAQNLVLEISNPREITQEDLTTMQAVDTALESQENWPLNSVAGTIFPLDLYRRYGRPDFYAEFERMMKRGKAPSTWGTYALRMIARRGKSPREIINPLEKIVEKISDAGQPDGASFQSCYELGLTAPEEDHVEGAPDIGGELPTYDPGLDGNRWRGLPCLSHVSFKRVANGTGHAVNLTAMYRSHSYCARALGNLLGLAQLQSFVAKEAGLAVGTLTCLSTHATLDVEAWGGITVARGILNPQT